MRIPLTQYGLREVAIMTAACAALAALALASFPAAALLPGLLWLYVLAFFRDPSRTPESPLGLLSPADGVVVDITPMPAGAALECESVRVGIFMGLLDVHVNRCPCDGAVRQITHRAGGFVDARRPEAAEVNESSTVALAARADGLEFGLVVRQVAGLIARRIVTDLSPGQAVQRGQRIGMIKFGSRAELIVPKAVLSEVAVKLGQRVLGGKTVLVRLASREKA